MSIDDLYNNFKIVEQSVKKYVGPSSGAQNLTFMTAPSTSSTNDVNTAIPAYEVSTASPNQDLDKIHEDDLEAMDLKLQLSLLSMRAKRECRAPRNKEGFDWSDMAEEQVQTNMALMAFSDSELQQQTYKRGLATVEEQLVTFRKNEVLFSEKVIVLKREVACKDYEINVLKTEYEKVKQEKEGIDFKIEKLIRPQQIQDKFVCSRHILGNYNASLSDFKEFDRGYVTFGGGAHGGRISGKGTLKTDSLDFEDILLKIPKKDNMYSFDMKNIVPKESLTCLVVKATLDESMLGIGSVGESNTERSCKSKVLNPITKPFDYASYGFVVVQPFVSRLNAYEVLHSITVINISLHGSDNGTEFKNKVMDDFCREKGIKREYSVARTPQQNGTQGELNAGTTEEISQDCIVMPIWKDASYFDSPSKDVDIGEPKSAADDQKQVEDGLDNENDVKNKSNDDLYPPSPIDVTIILDLITPKYLAPSDAEAPLEDQPLAADASPTALSPGYMADSDPDEDLEEDPEEDHTDYPADRGDGDDEPSDDDDDDDDTDYEDEEPFEDEDDDDDEEEHLAPANSLAIPIVDPVPLAGDTEAFETAGIRMRAASPPLLLPSTSHRTDIPEAEMPPRKRACLTTPAARLEIRESSTAYAMRQPGTTLEADLRRDKVMETGYEITDT
ncbi:ribonuclease H-like domain-containing protein [Tanacetum coccineum]